MSLVVTIEGLDRIQGLVDPAQYDRAFSRAMDRAGEVWRDATKRMPPVSVARTGYGVKGIPVAPLYGGTLRQQIKARRVSAVATEVYGAIHYASYVHEGTAKMPARPFFQWALEDFGGMQAIQQVFDREISSLLNA